MIGAEKDKLSDYSSRYRGYPNFNYKAGKIVPFFNL